MLDLSDLKVPPVILVTQDCQGLLVLQVSKVHLALLDLAELKVDRDHQDHKDQADLEAAWDQLEKLELLGQKANQVPLLLK